MAFSYTIFPLGDAALTVDFGNVISEPVNRYVLHLFQQLQSRSLSYVRDVVPAYASLTVHYDVMAVRQQFNAPTAFAAVSNEMKKIIDAAKDAAPEKKKTVRIPVCYAPDMAPDIAYVAQQKALSPNGVAYWHTAKKYRVYMIGFLPGFPYLGEVDERIAVPRKESPRTQVAAGSVGIAGRQTGIYSLNSPGGWQIIGRTPLKLFDPHNENPVLLQPGDDVQFYSITADEFANY